MWDEYFRFWALVAAFFAMIGLLATQYELCVAMPHTWFVGLACGVALAIALSLWRHFR